MSFYAKSVSFWPKEWIFKYSDKIMSCKLWSKVTSVFLNINFCAKMSILGKNNWSPVRNVEFLKLLCTTTESEYLIGKHAFYGNSINIHLLGFFCMQNSYLQWKQWKILRFSWKCKNNRKLFIFVNCLRFSLKLLSRMSTKSHKILFLDGKENKLNKIRNFKIFEKMDWIAKLY